MLINLIMQYLTANPFPFILIELFEYERNGFRFQTNSRLALIVKRTIQTAGIKVNFHS